MWKSMILWVVLALAAVGVSVVVTAQQVQRPVDQVRVLSGDNFGFRVEGQRRESRTDSRTGETAPVDILTGRLVVRVNGQWIEAQFAGVGVRPASD